jgi:hypothetical protein
MGGRRVRAIGRELSNLRCRLGHGRENTWAPGQAAQYGNMQGLEILVLCKGVMPKLTG